MNHVVSGPQFNVLLKKWIVIYDIVPSGERWTWKKKYKQNIKPFPDKETADHWIKEQVKK